MLNITLAFPSWFFFRDTNRTGWKHDPIQFEARYAGTLPWSHRRIIQFICFRSPIASAHAKQCWRSVRVGPNSMTTEIWSNIYIYICSPPPPQDLLFASFCLPKVLPESFLHNLKEKQKKQKKTKKPKPWGKCLSQSFLRVFGFFVFFGFSVCSVYGSFGHILEKNTFHYRPLVFTISLRKRLFPKYVRQFILNFFLWRPDFSKGRSLLSLKTGLFQREVASREESSIWTNRLCVKQDFVKRKKRIIWTKLVRWGLSFKKKCYLERKWIIRKNVF